ncbi:MAG: ATP-binding cassette domain-containing protein [Hyphomicrobiales bacterium]|nr:ATP-binding cassette domain-containing protein [Hyphomicrobiales bacterium]
MPELDEKAKGSKNLDKLIRFQNVTLKIGHHQLIHDISCSINTTGKIVVMGPNGAGKSLFLRLLAGLMKPTAGKITRGAHFLEHNQNMNLSMVFQNPVLLRRSTRANIEYALQRMNISRQQRLQLISSALGVARLEEKALISARRLSGGEQQRLALARAMVVKPKLLLLDEVTASLDPASTQIVETMIDEAANSGTKVVLITHDVRQAKRIADNILFIHQGKIFAYEPVRKFFRDPGSHEAQAYLDGKLPNPDLGSE